MATNANSTGSNTASVHIDTIPPTVAISGAPTIEKNVAYDLTVTFSEAVKGFAVPADLTLGLTHEAGATPIAAATLKSGSDGDAAYTVTITPNAAGSEGDVAVTVDANTVQDMATNANSTGSNTASVHIDTIPPTVAISGAPTIEKNVAYDLTVTFSEAVKGFAVPADLTLGLTHEAGATPIAAATLKSGSDGDAAYTVTITPNAAGSEGDVTVTVNANSVQDFALNNNTASTETDVVHVDTIIPTVSVSGFPPAPPEQNGPFTLTVTFSEEVKGFAVPADLTLTGPATAALASGTDGAIVYTVTITPNAASEGDVTVTVNASTVQDFALNDNTASPETTSVHVDTIPPTVSMVVTPPVTIGAETGYPTEERNAPYDLTVTFSEEVNGFAVPADLTVTGPGTAALTAGSDGDTVYTVTITPNATSEGDVTVTVNANAIQDFATNPNPAGSAPVEVHIDTIPPTFTIEDTPVLQRRNDFFDIRIVFSEEVNDFRVPGDLTPSDLVTPSLRAGADGASEYIVRMTPNEDVQGNLFIEVNAETVQDLALNLNADSVETQQQVRIDTIAPTVEFADLPTGAKSDAFDVTITFSEVVNGFTTEDIALVGPATVRLTAGTDGDATYTARVTPNPNASGNITLQIPAAVVEDLAENVNIASDLTDPIPIDTNALTVELQDVPQTVQLDAFSVMIVFSKDVEGFVLGDIEITGDAVVRNSTLLGSGSTYVLTITPDKNTDGDVIITVPANVAQDASGKSNAASMPQTVAVAPKWIPDASFRDIFREQLNLGSGEDFTQQQLRTITTLEFEMTGISDITGVEQATRLTTLVIPANEIMDLTPLRRLTKLTALNLAGNAITDITPLAGLTRLTSLNLGGNGLTGIAALEDLTSLTTLDLSNNALMDISLLENFTKLTALNLSGNRITDISPLAALTRLTTLSLNDNPIADFTPLAGLTALTTLELGRTGLSSTDIALLANLTALTELNLSGNTVGDLAGLAGLTGLTMLSLNDSAVVDTTPLSSLTSLTILELADNAITTLTPLTALTSLARLDLTNNSITDVGPILDLANLETLRLMGNPILNTSPLYPLTRRARRVDIDIEVSQYPPWDVNEDGTVDAADSTLVTAALGQAGDAIVNPRTDVNADGTVNNADVLLVTSNFDGVAGAPAPENLLSRLDAKTLRTLDRETLETHLNQLRLESDGSLKYQKAIVLLESLLAALRPTETRLLANYPNPFNPETWLPYELAADSSVEIFIYDARGGLVRHLKLGHQSAGYYVAKSRAAYWDGRNKHGERVASGIYFYQLRAGDISRLRKMVILK
ncbi:MAG: Ig-like domain-containing protein [Candidatus Poribacteria bacterium]|nr:Ig-like domain-containing protein [Candidatus Poribacteria bacterium]